ncbi:enoyl-CoA hydratase [Desertibaculum subflavum]|uniref:enoyl-CoA hydratase n=1 Tax=Desertibaculum subflavum TaxID=2268458 RepID=UPI000E671B77
MAYQEVAYNVEDRIATVTLNRPDKLNAWTGVMENEVRDAMEAAAKDDKVRVIILTGAGRGFCAGADMNVLSGITEKGADARPNANNVRPYDTAARPDFQMRYSYFPSIAKPIIAAVNGPAAGLGLIMALYCDMRFAADAAVFTTAFSRRGLIAEHGISWLLPKLVGHSVALDLMLSARKVDSAEALRIGLVNRVSPLPRLMDDVRAYAKELAEDVSPRSMAVMKQQLWNVPFQSLGESIAVANHEMKGSFVSEDFKEGVAHFVEKRKARFTGR